MTNHIQKKKKISQWAGMDAEVEVLNLDAGSMMDRASPRKD